MNKRQLLKPGRRFKKEKFTTIAAAAAAANNNNNNNNNTSASLPLPRLPKSTQSIDRDRDFVTTTTTTKVSSVSHSRAVPEEDYFTIWVLRVLSDKLGAVSMLLFIVNIFIASFNHFLSIFQVEFLLFSLTLEILWQLSETLFLLAAFFGLLKMFLTWVHTYRDMCVTVLLFSLFILLLVPLSYLFVGLEELRWVSTRKATRKALENVVVETMLQMRRFLWGAEANKHWMWLGQDDDWYNMCAFRGGPLSGAGG